MLQNDYLLGNICMATYTVFAFGTGEKHTMEKKNIISQFSEACASEHTIIDGPGVLGREVKLNALTTFNNLIVWLEKQTDIINNINLTGFSRGSVTCIEIANHLKNLERELEKKAVLTAKDKRVLERLKALDMHIFAIDPVAGLGDKGIESRRTIPSNVKDYVGILQIDEMRRDFKPQDLTRIIIENPLNTKVSMLPMYGNHSDSTKVRSLHQQSGARILWHSLYAFLTTHGTNFNDNKIPKLVTSCPMLIKQHGSPFSELTSSPNSKGLLNLFSQHHQEREAYLKSGKELHFIDGLPVPRSKRSLNNHLEFYVKNSNFFVNQLERELFKLSYPRVFNYYFEQNQTDERFIQESNSGMLALTEALQQLHKETPALFARLVTSRHIKIKNGVLNPGQPGGLHCLERCATLQHMYPSMLPNGYNEPLFSDEQRLVNLEKAIFRLTFRYERERSSLSFFSCKNYAPQVQKLRQDVKTIVEAAGSVGSKHLQILEKIESQVQYLVQSRSNSHLITMLVDELAKNGRYYQIKEHSMHRVLLADFIYITLTFLKESIRFISYNLGGVILSLLGTAFEEFGKRCNETLGNLGYNPLKHLAAAIATTFQVLGFAIKHQFGLKPLIDLLSVCISKVRDAAVISVKAVEIKRLEENSDLVEALLENTDPLNKVLIEHSDLTPA